MVEISPYSRMIGGELWLCYSDSGADEVCKAFNLEDINLFSHI